MRDNHWEIRAASNFQEQQAALLLMIHEDDQNIKQQEIEKIFASVEKGRFSLKHLLIASSDQNILAASLMLAQQDQTAILWPAAVDEKLKNSPAGESIQEALLKQSISLAKKEACVQIQTTVEQGDTLTSARYEKNGLAAIGQLFYMQRPAPDQQAGRTGEVAETDEHLKLIPVSQGISEDILGELLLRTYIDSADFPELQHTRTASRSLQTHRLQGEYSPEHWFLIEYDRTAAGVLFFSWHPDLNQWELTYLGIVPEQRGKGIAKKAVAASFAHPSRKNNAVFLGVDSRNSFATRLYESLGFLVVSRQKVHVLQFG